MALPVILVNSATGSDTVASGAGPATALTGTAASFAAAVVTLDGSPDLTNVATDGSHTLYLVTSTGVKHFKITAKDNGADTVDVTPNPAGTASGLTWGIGGKRASIGATTSRLLFDNAGAAGDAMPGWAVEMESGHTETLSDRLVFRRAGDTTSGPITLRGTRGAATPPVLTWNTNDIALFPAASYQHVLDFEIQNTNATKTASEAIRMQTASGGMIRGIKIAHATNNFWRGINVVGEAGTIDSCDIGYTETSGVRMGTGGSFSTVIRNNYIHSVAGTGLDLDDAGDLFVALNIEGNVVYDCNTGLSASAANSTSGRLVLANNVFHANIGDGAFLDNTNSGWISALIENNIFSNNGGYGINFDNLTLVFLQAYGVTIRNNDFYSNASGKYLPSDVGSLDEQTLDPQFTNAAGGDFSIGTNLKALGFPTGFIGKSSATRSYVDVGAAQRQETSVTELAWGVLVDAQEFAR
jgi:hypothetical protein